MRPRAGLVTGVLVAVAAGAIAVALGVTLLLTHIVDLRRSANASLRTGAYLDATINLERLVVDAETGLRGYVITGDRAFLAPERSAVADMPAAAAVLKRAAAKDGAFLTQSEQLVSSARSYLDTYVPQVIREVRTDPASARSVATTALGKQSVDETRLRSAALQRQISARQAARQRAARASANNSVDVAIVVLIALTLLTLALGGVLGWLLVGRERARQRTEELYRHTEQTARTLQESLLPAQIPEVPSCELAIRFTPAGADDLVGGDFYDVFAVGPDHWAIVVGDVCGKGAGAAAVTAMARWTLRTLATTALSPAGRSAHAQRRHAPPGRGAAVHHDHLRAARGAGLGGACADRLRRASAGDRGLGNRRTGRGAGLRRPARGLAGHPAARGRADPSARREPDVLHRRRDRSGPRGRALTGTGDPEAEWGPQRRRARRRTARRGQTVDGRPARRCGDRRAALPPRGGRRLGARVDRRPSGRLG
jgi:CHASE3 domain sensor protein